MAFISTGMNILYMRVCTSASLPIDIIHYLDTGEEATLTGADASWLKKFLQNEYKTVGGCGRPDVLPKFADTR